MVHPTGICAPPSGVRLYDNAKCVVHPTMRNALIRALRLYDNAKCVVHPTRRSACSLAAYCMTMQNVCYIPTIIKACHNVGHDRMLVRCRTIQTLSRTYEIICKNYDARRVAEKN